MQEAGDSDVKVAYVTMKFPVPSETFACTDVRALRESGVTVSVYALRRPLDGASRMLADRKLSDLTVSQGTRGADVRGCLAAVARPMVAARLVLWILRVAWTQPAHLVKSLALVPRSMGILAELQRDRPDVVHLFWGHYPSLVGFLVLEALPDSIVSLFIGTYDLERRFEGTGWVARRAAVVSTHARCNFPDIEALGVDRGSIHLAYRGIDPTIFNRDRPKVRGRIVSAGRLDADKGMADVLHAFNRIVALWPEATLRILGNGPERERLERLSATLGLRNAVTFLGHVPHHVVADELAQAEIFLHLSRSLDDRLPNAIKEAMASRCICVVTETAGIDELVEDERHGFVVGQGDVGRAAARVDEIFRRRLDVTAISQAASDRIVRHFNVAESMRSYQRRWVEALGARGASV